MVKKYTDLSGKYLKEAEVLLKKSDLSQASEKLWGSFATIKIMVGEVKNPRPKDVALCYYPLKGGMGIP